MRENCTSGSMRGVGGKGVALQQPPAAPTLPVNFPNVKEVQCTKLISYDFLRDHFAVSHSRSFAYIRG